MNDVDEALTHEEKQLIKCALKGASIALIAFILARNVTQVELPILQLSLALGLMSCFNSMMGLVKVVLAVITLQVLIPVSLITELIKHF